MSCELTGTFHNTYLTTIPCSLFDPYTTGGVQPTVTLLIVVDTTLTSVTASVPDVIPIIVALGNHESSGGGFSRGRERVRRNSLPVHENTLGGYDSEK